MPKTDTRVLRKPVNYMAWAIGTERDDGRMKVRRIVWGRALARAEKRAGEVIKPAWIFVREEIIG